MTATDTIVAIATPAGRGGLGIVRLSGPRAFAIAGELFGPDALVPMRLRRARFVDEAGALLDEVLVSCFVAPHSYTAEDVVEVSAHGAPVLLAALLEACQARGARLAEPGEFTRRAFLHGRLDLTQAEAVRDLIESHTLFQARSAARQLSGSVAAELRPLRQHSLNLIARLEAGIDFADDDVPIAAAAELLGSIEFMMAECDRLLDGFRHGRLVREGLVLAIVGRPNVGKSSLFNRLLERERAIVTAEPGTTRDLIAETLVLEDIPVRLLDTAGIHGSAGRVESLGIERSWQAIADADLVLAVFDGSAPPAAADLELWPRLAPLLGRLIVLNKSDLPAAPAMTDWIAAASPEAESVAVSALTGEGMVALRRRIRSLVAADAGEGAEFLTNVRHAQQLQALRAALERAGTALSAGTPHEAVLVDLYAGQRELDAIAGHSGVEDILGIIFASFCIGK